MSKNIVHEELEKVEVENEEKQEEIQDDASEKEKQETIKEKEEKEEKLYSEQEVNRIVANRLKRERETLETKGLSEYEETIKELKASLDEIKAEKEQAEAKNILLKYNVNDGASEDVLVLAKNQQGEKETLEESIKKVLEKYPHFKKEEEEAQAITTGNPGKQEPKDKIDYEELFKKYRI